MAASATFEKLKTYLESRPASQKAVAHLRNGVEISIVIGHQIECALINDGGKPRMERRPAQKFDVIFYVKPESVDVLAQHPGEDVGEFGIAILKEYLSGGVRIQVVGNMLNIMRNGYLNIIREGGGNFAKYIASHGLTSGTRIISAIKSFRKES